MIELIILKITVIRNSIAIIVAAFSNRFLLINILELILRGKSKFEVIKSSKAITAKKRLKSQKSKGNIMCPLLLFLLQLSFFRYVFIRFPFLHRESKRNDC
jgi:hypothetical protein